MVINTGTDKVIDSVEVAMEPESMVIDRDKILWVLCNGGWMREVNAELVAINTSTDKVIKNLIFPTKPESPTCLQIDGSGTTLYYLERGVRKLKTDAVSVPSAVFIPESGHYYYKLGINPVNNDVLVTDAVDYQQKGHLIIYSGDGTLITDLLADIIPGTMSFKLNSDFNP
jgi:DNA-binding beta-propeller fold protein YncE